MTEATCATCPFLYTKHPAADAIGREKELQYFCRRSAPAAEQTWTTPVAWCGEHPERNPYVKLLSTLIDISK